MTGFPLPSKTAYSRPRMLVGFKPCPAMKPSFALLISLMALLAGCASISTQVTRSNALPPGGVPTNPTFSFVAGTPTENQAAYRGLIAESLSKAGWTQTDPARAAYVVSDTYGGYGNEQILVLVIREYRSARTVFEASARSEGTSASIPGLVKAIFQDFPGENGQTVTY